MARFRNAHSSSIDGVAPGQAGDFNPAVVKGLVDAGLLVPVGAVGVEGPVRVIHAAQDELDALRAQFDAAWAERGRELATLREDLRASEALRAAAEARVTELEVENAQLKLDLEAATAPKV